MKRKLLWIVVTELAMIAGGGVLALKAQATPEQRLVRTSALEPAAAIVELRRLLDSRLLDARGEGRAWEMLGAAFEETGDRASAQQAYQEAIRILERLPDGSKEYALALDDMGGLYVAAGQLGEAARLRVKALHVYEKMDDRVGVTRSFSDLAGIAFNQRKIKEGRRYLEQAVEAARLTNGLGDGDLAAIASMQGTLAEHDRDFGAAVLSYRRSFELWRRSRGEDDPYTGWGYMLLGEAHAGTGDLTAAVAEMTRGLGILGRTLKHEDVRYLTAEVAYSRVLDATGNRDGAKRLRSEAEQRLQELYGSRCIDCTISVAAFR